MDATSAENEIDKLQRDIETVQRLSKELGMEAGYELQVVLGRLKSALQAAEAKLDPHDEAKSWVKFYTSFETEIGACRLPAHLNRDTIIKLLDYIVYLESQIKNRGAKI
jgi:hypothetical protein